MLDWLATGYLWIKALHLISVIAWMAGLLYLPRLFVYHCDAAPGSDRSETFKVMERRLLHAIMTPAMIAAFVFGGLLLLMPQGVDWSSGWIYGKLALVAALTAFHYLATRWCRGFEADRNTRSARYYRVANEVPTVIMIGIVILTVVKPF